MVFVIPIAKTRLVALNSFRAVCATSQRGGLRLGVLFLGALIVVGFCSEDPEAQDNPREMLRITSLKELDVTKPVQSVEGESMPAYKYQCSVSPDGELGIVRQGTTQGLVIDPGNTTENKILEALERESDAQTKGALLLGEAQRKWEDFRFDGAGPSIWGSPQPLFDPMGLPFLVWLSWDPPYPTGQPRIVMSHQTSGGIWTDKVTVSDVQAADITSFFAVSIAPSQAEIVWTDSREMHSLTPTLPEHRESSKVFARSWENGLLSTVDGLTPRSGKYVADRIRACADRSGDIYAAWDQTDGKGESQLYLAVRHKSSWSRPIKVSEDKVQKKILYPDRFASIIPNYHIVFDVVPLNAGSVAVFWLRGQAKSEICYRIYDGRKLGSIRVVVDQSNTMSVAASSNGAIHIIYQEPRSLPGQKGTSSFQWGTLNYKRLLARNWSERQEIAQNVFLGSEKIFVDKMDRIHMFWQEMAAGECHFMHAIGEIVGSEVDHRN